jgi:hypothetical protein
MMRVYLSVAIAVCFAALPASTFAQGEQGRVSGIVRDQSNAFVAEAKVLVKSEKTGEERRAVTNSQGYFIIGSLRPSTYTIAVEKDGFATIEYTAMPVATGHELTIDFELKPAGVQESVNVVGVAPVLDLSSAKIGVNVREREVTGRPVQRRQMSQLTAGAGLAECGHRHVGRHSLLRALLSRQNDDQSTASRLRASSIPRLASLTARTRASSSFRRA